MHLSFLLSQEKRQVEEELYRWGVLRYGWREEDLEGVPGVKVIHEGGACFPPEGETSRQWRAASKEIPLLL